ncbi:Uncharacterised protein [uncultured Blautia sp.]|nr:hypothetical protein [uncultured Blautia sp.]SCH34531.1 Uncharacterised protein [uncultured Blautia sp.]
MKNKKFIALLAMTVALSGVMTACSFGGGKEDSVVVESTPTPTPAKKATATPTVAADAQNTTYTSKDKSVAIKLPDATWANKSDETDMLSFESPDQGKILILHGSGADLESAVIPNSQDMAVSMTQAENMVNGTDFEIQDYKSDQKDGINIYSYTVKYKDTTKSDGYVYAINKYFVNDSEYYSLVASVKKEDALKKVQESVDSFAILGDSTLKSAANGSAAKTAGKGNAAASSDGSASSDGTAADGTSSDGTAASDGSTSSDGSAAADGSSTDGSSTADGTTSDGSSDGSTSSAGSSSGAIVNGGFTDEQLGNTDETRTIYRNSDGKPRVIVPDGNGAWMDNEGNRFTFSSQYDCDVYEEDGTSFYWHGEAADVYYMPVQ